MVVQAGGGVGALTILGPPMAQTIAKLRPRLGQTVEMFRTGEATATGQTIETFRTGEATVMGQTIEKPRVSGPGSGLGGNWRVIVLNDDHNTFDHVARTLARTIPGVSVDRGYEIANRIHTSGRAIVWSGMKEPAEHYWEQLSSAGLTMAPLEQG